MIKKFDFFRIFEFFRFFFGIFRFFTICLILKAIFSLKIDIFYIFGGPRGPPIDWGAPGIPNGYNVNVVALKHFETNYQVPFNRFSFFLGVLTGIIELLSYSGPNQAPERPSTSNRAWGPPGAPQIIIVQHLL